MTESIPQGYKQTEIGIIPEDWDVKILGEFTDIKTGKRNGNEEVEDGKYPFFVRSQKVKRINTFSFEGEAILIPGEGGIGTIIHYINGKFDYHQRVYKISNFGEENSAKFIYYSMLQNFDKHATKNSVKATVDSLRLPTFLEFEFPCPKSKEEQSAIATALSETDELIQKLNKLITKKKDIKKGAMQELLTGKKRLPGFSGEWEEKEIKNIIIKKNKTKRKSGDGLIEGKFPFFTNSTSNFNTYLNEFDFDGEMIIANTGGMAYFDYYNGKFASMSDCFIFETKDNVKFVYFKLKLIQDYINDVGFTGSGIKHLDKKLFGNIILRIPKDSKEQSAIASILSNMDSEIEELEQKRNKYQMIKEGMMQQLLTGRIRLKWK